LLLGHPVGATTPEVEKLLNFQCIVECKRLSGLSKLLFGFGFVIKFHKKNYAVFNPDNIYLITAIQITSKL